MRREEEREVVGKKKELQEIDFDFFFFVNEIIFHAKLNLNNRIITWKVAWIYFIKLIYLFFKKLNFFYKFYVKE